ncbi:thiamine ABC transporter substrate-binding protein [Natronosalvus halobius]|uniref:thiamine ABC transporter substrate-binding protein n=1 Tax=Natronosalvus halobius TaxID=2953746 RepID=UPI0020A149C7|nr:extracellular solute-binding protein [Natronosalvus halobius]USZ70551.1 extracellular solute-binding protein [Natronosalvus halobius]
MRRRTFLTSTAGGTIVGVAGCIQDTSDGDGDGNGNGNGDGANGNGDANDSNGNGNGNGNADDDTLHVATYTSFVDAPSDSPGVWIKEEFEQRYDATLEWHTPERELTHYVERYNEGAEIEPELYYGASPHDLVRVDENTDGDLFVETDRSVLENADDIGEQHEFDPQGRVIPTYRALCAIVYDGRTGLTPETFEDLLDPAYEGQIGIPTPQDTTGLLFLLWTLNEFGEGGEYDYLDYWSDLLDNGARVLDSWSDVYTQFENDELPIIVSYANDRVYAKRFGNDLEKHQVALLDGQSYANYSGVVRFSSGTNDDLAHKFIDFVLDPEVQAVVAERNVTGPTNEKTELPEVFEEYAREPEEPVFYDYEELSGNLSGWLDDWSRMAAGGR